MFIDDHRLFRELELHHLSFALNIFSLSKSQAREEKNEANDEEQLLFQRILFSRSTSFEITLPCTLRGAGPVPPSPAP